MSFLTDSGVIPQQIIWRSSDSEFANCNGITSRYGEIKNNFILSNYLPLLLLFITYDFEMKTMILILMIPLIVYLFNLRKTLINFYYRKIRIPHYYYEIQLSVENCNDLIEVLYFCYPDKYHKFINNNMKNIKSPDYNFIIKNFLYLAQNIYFQKIYFSNEIVKKLIDHGYRFPSDINISELTSKPFYLLMDNHYVYNQFGHKKSYYDITFYGKNYQCTSDLIGILLSARKYLDVYNDNQIYKIKYKKQMQWFNACKPLNFQKSFQNMFLRKQQEEIIINSIKINYLERTKFGLSTNLTFLFTGLNGCGMKSLIHTLAFETKKTFISYFDSKTANFLFYREFINCLVVIENIEKCSFMKKGNLKEKDRKFLSSMLELLDGYHQIKNSIIIFTTTNPKIIRPEILEPSRINHIIDFKLCDEYQFNKMFTYYTGEKYHEIDDQFVFCENKYTTSYLIKIVILPNRKNPKRILEILSQDIN